MNGDKFAKSAAAAIRWFRADGNPEGVVGKMAPWPELAIAARKTRLIENAARIAQAARDHAAPVIHCTAENLPGRFGANRNARLFGSARKVTAAARQEGRFEASILETWSDGDILLPRYHGVSPMIFEQV